MRLGPAGRNPKRSRLRRQKSRARSAARRFWVFRPADGRPFSRPSGAFQMCRLRRRRLPGPAPAGGPTSCAPKKSAEEGRSRGLPPVPLRNPREYLAITRRLPPLPTGTPAEGSIQVAGAPNGRSRMARITHGGKQRPFRAFARAARVRGEAAQFSASPWALRATQKRPCLPGSTPGTVPESRRQRHCARGAAAGGLR